jgi:two-component system, OmpR family, sensor kinase
VASNQPSPCSRRLEILERLLGIEVADLEMALTHSCDVIADALKADKVDAFLYEPGKDTLMALGSSTQPLSMLQKKLGLDLLPVGNGGRVVSVYQTGETYANGRVEDDPEELKGLKQGLKIRSQIGVPLTVGGRRRGVLMIASLEGDFFTPEDVRFVESIVTWVGVVTHKAEMAQEIARNAVEQGRRAVAEELITVLAHDLRNFVTPIAARLQLMRRRASDENRTRDVRDCDAAQPAVDRLNRLISDLLDVARLDQGVLKLDLQPINLSGIARDVARALATPDHPVQVSCSEETVVAARASVVGRVARRAGRATAIRPMRQKRRPENHVATMVSGPVRGRGLEPRWLLTASTSS